MPRGDVNRERDVREAYAAHATELYGLAIRSLGDPELSEEAVQQTFLLAWRAEDISTPKSAASAAGSSQPCAAWWSTLEVPGPRDRRSPGTE
jgi:Sigma-70 region 2